jgi:outer membrane protein assembly factor BamB
VTSIDAVEMIKQFPERVSCFSLSFHGDSVYIGILRFVVQWNVVTDAVVRLEGYQGLIFSLFAQFDPTLILGQIYGLDVSSDGSVVVGAGHEVVMAHSTATGAALWRKEVPDWVWSLRIHGGVVVIPVDNSNTLVLDVTTGQKLHTLPSAGENVRGVCVFDGLTIYVTCFQLFTHTILLI